MLVLVETLALTQVIELTVAFLLKIRNKYDIVYIALINCVTNPLINTIYAGIIIYFKVPEDSFIKYLTVFILELAVWFSEGLFFKKMLEYKKISGFILSLILNATSFLLGLLIL